MLWALAAWDELRIHPTLVPKAIRALPPAPAAVFISLRMDPRDSRGSPGSGVTAMQRKSLPGSGYPEGKRPAVPRSHGVGSGAGAREGAGTRGALPTGSRRARGSLPRRGASEEDLAHGGAWETASLLVWDRLWVRCHGLGEPKKGHSQGAAGAAAILCSPSPRAGCDFGGQEGLPLKSRMPHMFSFSFFPHFNSLRWYFQPSQLLKGRWQTHTWWALHV